MSAVKQGFLKDIAILIVVSVVLAAFTSLLIGEGVHRYFGDTVTGLIGDYGEYDILLTAAEANRESVEYELRALLEERDPGAFLKTGVSIAGRTNLFLRLENARNEEGFSYLIEQMDKMEGLHSYTIMAEPRLSLRGVPGGAVSWLQEKTKRWEGIDFVLKTSSGLDLIVTDPGYLPSLNRRVEELMDSYQILNLPLPQDMGPGVVEELEGEWGVKVENVSGSPREISSPEIRAVENTISGMLPYIPHVHFGESLKPGTQIFLLDGEKESGPFGVFSNGEKESLLLPLPGAEIETSEGYLYTEEGEGLGWAELTAELPVPPEMEQGLSTLEIFRENLSSWREKWALEKHLGELNSFIASWEKRGEEIAAARFWDDWLDRLNRLGEILNYRRVLVSPSSPLEPRLARVSEDISQLEAQLLTARDVWQEKPPREGLLELETILTSELENMESWEEELLLLEEKLNQGLSQPHKPQDELLQALWSWQDLTQPREGQLKLLLPGSMERREVLADLREVLGSAGGGGSFQEIGVFQPDVRGELFRILGEVRELLIALTGLVFTLAFLVLDHSAVISFFREIRLSRGQRFLQLEKIYGIAAGALSLWGVITLGGGEVPYLNDWWILLTGASAGLLVAWLAPKLNPVNSEEFMAGEALGLSRTRIFREIILPSSRPGLLFLLNRQNLIFR